MEGKDQLKQQLKELKNTTRTNRRECRRGVAPIPELLPITAALRQLQLDMSKLFVSEPVRSLLIYDRSDVALRPLLRCLTKNIQFEDIDLNLTSKNRFKGCFSLPPDSEPRHNEKYIYIENMELLTGYKKQTVLDFMKTDYRGTTLVGVMKSLKIIDVNLVESADKLLVLDMMEDGSYSLKEVGKFELGAFYCN